MLVLRDLERRGARRRDDDEGGGGGGSDGGGCKVSSRDSAAESSSWSSESDGGEKGALEAVARGKLGSFGNEGRASASRGAAFCSLVSCCWRAWAFERREEAWAVERLRV